MNNNLGNNIRAFRKNKGLTQEELADLLNITPQAVSRWESMAGMPDVSMLIPLAQKKEMIEILDKEIGYYGKYA